MNATSKSEAASLYILRFDELRAGTEADHVPKALKRKSSLGRLEGDS
jgi:hypothetical protein